MRGQVAVAVDKSADSQPAALIETVFGAKFGRFPMSMLMQRVVIVDADVDVHDPEDVEWAIASRVVQANQVSVIEDRTGRGATVTRLGIDATSPLELRAALRRPEITGAREYPLDRYLKE